jgi:hypothetical protein
MIEIRVDVGPRGGREEFQELQELQNGENAIFFEKS